MDRAHGGEDAAGVIDFSVSINPLGPSAAALEEYHAAAGAISSYPPAYPEKLSARLAEWLGIGPQQVIIGNGSTQLIHLFARVYPVRLPFVAIPTFSEFANALSLNNSIPRPIELERERGFMVRLAQVQTVLRDGAEAVFIGRPNSPTGSMIPLSEAKAIARECATSDAFCIYDEAFIDFAGRGESAIESMKTAADWSKNVIIIRSLTKIFAIPGLRIGFIAGPSAIIEKLRGHLEPWSVNVVAERVALGCLEQADEFILNTREWLTAERAYLREQLSAIEGVRVFPSSANFLLLEVDESQGESTLGQFTLQKGIAVRDLRTMPGCEPGWYRVAVRLRSENDRLVSAIRAFEERK